MGRRAFLDALGRGGGGAFGTGTSIVCQDIMREVDVWFPEAHQDAEKMARLAETGCTMLGFDVVMPLFSVCHEAAAMGCKVQWGGPDAMPESGKPIFATAEDIRIPGDLLTRAGCAVPLEAIRLLRERLGDDAAVCGKVFGGWTQAYHYFGVENFLMLTVDDAGAAERILEMLWPVTVQFARAQIEAGADCLLVADHATRALCSPGAYEQFLQPMHTRLAEEIDCPLILHICGDTSDRVGMIAETGMACFHWDTASGEPSKVRGLAGERMALMGGVSNYSLLRGTAEEVAAMAEGAKGEVDIVGPECAIPLQTPLGNLKAIAGKNS